MRPEIFPALVRSHRAALTTLLVLLVAVGTPLPAQPRAPTHFDIFGEETGCAAPSLCGDFGSSVASAGDVNGDQVPDLVIGAPTVSSANPSTGRVYVFFGPFDGRDFPAEEADVTITGLEFGDLVGTAPEADAPGEERPLTMVTYERTVVKGIQHATLTFNAEDTRDPTFERSRNRVRNFMLDALRP